MNRLLAYVIVPAGIGILSGPAAVSTSLGNEATVYMLSCEGTQVDGVCHGSEKTDPPFTYKVSVDEHAVLYSTMDDAMSPRRFPFCVIHDTRSWLCQWEGYGIPKSRFGMVAGRYVEIATCMTGAKEQIFYQVPVWRWWLVRLHERLFESVGAG